jgi:hypothetical protein
MLVDSLYQLSPRSRIVDQSLHDHRPYGIYYTGRIVLTLTQLRPLYDHGIFTLSRSGGRGRSRRCRKIMFAGEGGLDSSPTSWLQNDTFGEWVELS